MPTPRPSIPNRTAFRMAGGLVYPKGEPMPEGAALLEGESPELYEADGENNWVLKAPGKKDKPDA